MRRIPWLLLVKIAVTLGLIALIVHSVDLAETWRRIRTSSPAAILGAVALLGVGYILCGLRWAWIAEGLGLRVSGARKVRLYFLGMFASLFLPSTIGGDVVRGLLLARGEGRRRPGIPAGASVILDRANGLVALVAILSLLIPGRGFPAGFVAAWFAGLALLIGLLVLAPRLWPRLPARLDRLRALPVDSSGFRRAWLRSLPVSALFQLIVIQAHVLLGGSVGLALSWTDYALMVGLSALVAIVPISLNGFGLREAGYVGLAAWLGGSPEAAAAMAALWVVALGIAALPGLWVLWRLGGVDAIRKARD